MSEKFLDRALREASEVLCIEPGDWEEVHGPETGVGLEYWFRSEENEASLYVCHDQGHTTWEVGYDDPSMEAVADSFEEPVYGFSP